MVKRMPAEVFPPGEFIQEELDARNWTQSDLADILGRRVNQVNQIIKGKTGVTPETAKALGAAFGTSPQYWLNLQAAYDLSKVQDQNDSIQRRANLYSIAPVKELAKRHWIEPSSNIEVMEKRIMEFYGITSLDAPIAPQVHAARKSTSYDDWASPSQVAWLRRAQQLAPAVWAERYSKQSFPEMIGRVRSLLESPEEIRRLPRILSDYGVRSLIVESLPQTKLDGATFWLDANSPVIVLSLRYDRLDYFWYTVFHELGHVGNEDGAMDVKIYEQNGEIAGSKPEIEQLADSFATDALLPKEELEDFIERVSPLYSRTRILGFAALYHVHPGIVVGQLHHRKEIPYSQHRKFLVPVRSIAIGSTLTDGWNNPVSVQPVVNGVN